MSIGSPVVPSFSNFLKDNDFFDIFKQASACNQSPERFCCSFALNEKIVL